MKRLLGDGGPAKKHRLPSFQGTISRIRNNDCLTPIAKKENENALSDHHIGNRFTASGRG
jgi:hypothetical protein